MALNSTVLFDVPQREIASLLVNRINRSSATSIVTGFATPGGIAAIASPIRANPKRLKTLIVGAATYPGFEALDGLIAAGVPVGRLHVHLGHTAATGGRNNPFHRYHPMLHSKIFYMELPGDQACAFVGSNNVTSFALGGLNGEAAVHLEGSMNDPEFEKVRQHIEAARRQSVQYSPDMKDAYAWWLREYLKGLSVEIAVPIDWTAGRTILLFAVAAPGDRPKNGDSLYFEIPSGIRIETLRTKTHLFLFDALPADPWEAVQSASFAEVQYECDTLGVENLQGNREVVAHWRVDGTKRPVLTRVPSNTYRPTISSDVQQVRAAIKDRLVESFEYSFEAKRETWHPQLSNQEQLSQQLPSEKPQPGGKASAENYPGKWNLVQGLITHEGKEQDEVALKLAAPESGS
jgi:hypothetical protein